MNNLPFGILAASEMTTNRTKLRLIFKKREKITSLPLYYEGFLWKKGAQDKSFQRYWSELRGCVIFFYSNENDEMYAEKLDLQKLLSLDHHGRETRSDLFTLQLAQEEIQLKAESTETKLEWQGYILVVSQLEVPTGLSLLPGQILQLQEVLEDEKERQSLVAATSEWQHILHEKPAAKPYDNVLNSMPECYYTVSRIEAESMLERNSENGSLIVRPASDNDKNYSISTLIPQTGKSIMKHYRVTTDGDRFILWLDNPVDFKDPMVLLDNIKGVSLSALANIAQITCFSLQEIINYFIKKTNGNLKPYLHPKVYANRIDTQSENLKGEHKHVPHARVASFQCIPELQRKLSLLQPSSPGAKHKIEPRYVVTGSSQQLLKQAPTHPSAPEEKEAEPSYMNNEFLHKINKMNCTANKPPNRTAPQSWTRNQFTGDGGDSDELMQKLLKRRQQLSDND